MLLSSVLNRVETLSEPPGNISISGVCSDLTDIIPGCAFVCIRGVKVDGHTKAKEAVKLGAVLIVAEEKTDAPAPHILVKDSRRTLALIWSNLYNNPAAAFKLIGITGTNGKTTTSYLIYRILSALNCRTGLIGTVENITGDDENSPSSYTTPNPSQLHALFTKMKDAGIFSVVMEVSSHALSQERVAGLYFEAAVFTNLSHDHLDYHGTMDNYLNAKLKLFSNAKCGIINRDDTYYEAFANTPCQKFYTFGIESDADFSAHDIKYGTDGTRCIIKSPYGQHHAFIATPGRFSVYNALAAVTVCSALGYEISDIIRALNGSKGVRGRLENIPSKHGFNIIIDYAHTPDGLYNVLKTLGGIIKKGRLITVFGCGGDRDREKRPKMGSIAAENSDFTIVTSDNPRTEKPADIISDILKGMSDTGSPYIVIEDRKEAIRHAIKNAKRGDVILLAGKGHEDYQIINSKKIEFDERDIVKEFLDTLEN